VGKPKAFGRHCAGLAITEGEGDPTMFDTKIAIVVREDLATWQKLNVTAFLTSGVVGAAEGPSW
jgi:hypothetical protein